MKLWRSRFWDVGVGLLALVCLVRIALMLPARAWDNDFAHSWISSRLMLEGRNPYTTPLEPLARQYGFQYHKESPMGTNPPALLWLFAPLARLRPLVAFWWWVAGELVCLAGILWLTYDLLRERLTRRGWFFVAVGVLTSATVFKHLYYSQVQLLLAALVLTGYWCGCRGWPLAGCALVAVAAVIKLFPVMLLPWFIWAGSANYRERFVRLGVVVGTVVVGVGLTGIGMWHDFWLDALPTLKSCAVDYYYSLSVPAFVITFGRAVAPWEGWWTVVTLTGISVVAGAYAICLRRRSDRELEFCLLCVAMLSGSLTVWGHYFVFLIFPMVVMVVRRAPRAWVFVLWLLLNDLETWTGQFVDRHQCVKILVNFLPLLGVLGLGAYFVLCPGDVVEPELQASEVLAGSEGG